MLPVLPLSAPASETVSKLRAACRDIGFFYVVEHGIEPAAIDTQLAWARSFFALPQAAREAVSIDKSTCMRGFAPIASQALEAGTLPDLKECFYMGNEHYGPNQWPEGLPGFREASERYFAEVCALGRRVMRLVARSLELPEAWFDPMFEQPTSVLRLLHYPPHPRQAPPELRGAGAHTDWGALTFLAQDGSGGLEVQNASGEWLAAPPLPGSFVVNLGDMIPRWTNGRYVSTPHRVTNNLGGGHRYSAALFFNPAHEARIECLPTCLAPGDTPRYLPCTAGEHVAEMYRITYGRASAKATTASSQCSGRPGLHRLDAPRR